jgi:hypothetical protein
LFALIIIWKSATLTPTSGENVTQMAPQPPDEAAVLVVGCGAPDVDRITPAKEGQESSRILLYRKAGVKVRFHHESSSPERWKLESVIDGRTSKPLTGDKVAKRLPCATSTHK